MGISAIGRKAVGETTYIQTFRDTNVVCIPSIESGACNTKDHKALMEVRAAQCASNYMSSCDFGIRDIISVNQNVNLDTLGAGKFGYEVNPEMSQTGDENKEFTVIASVSPSVRTAPRIALLLALCLACLMV